MTSELDRYSELLAPLYDKRKTLGYAYLLLFVVICAVFYIGPTVILAKLERIPTPDQGGLSRDSWIGLLFPVSQVLFLWSGGRITHERRSWARILLSSMIAAIVVTVAIGRLWGMFEMWDFELRDYASLVLRITFIATPLLIFPATILKSRRTDHYRTLVFLNLVMLASIGVVATLGIALAIAEAQAWGLSEIRADVFVVPGYMAVWVLGTSLILLWHRASPKDDPAAAAVKCNKDTQDAVSGGSGPYIASAASVSSLLLIVLYFGISQSISYGSHLKEIGDARSSFALESFRNYVSPLFKPNDFQRVLDTNGTGVDAMRTAVRNVHIPPTLGIVEERLSIGPELYESQLGRLCLLAWVKEYQIGRVWVGRCCFDTKILAKPDSSLELAADPPADDMATVGLRYGLKPEKGENFEALYLRVENELLRKEVAFPNSGFSFPVEQAVWLSNLVVCLMLVLLHDRIGHAFGDPKPGRGEPWLVLDARDRIAEVVAVLWCLAIGFGPWLLIVTTARMVDFNVGVYQSRVASLILRLSAGIIFFLTCVPLSLSVVSQVLRLRRLRRFPQNVSASSVDSAPSAHSENDPPLRGGA